MFKDRKRIIAEEPEATEYSVAFSDERERCGYCCAGYAIIRYQTWQRPYGNFFKWYCTAGLIFCGGKWEDEYQTAAGGGDCSGKGQGRSVRKAADYYAGILWENSSFMGKKRDNRGRSCPKMRGKRIHVLPETEGVPSRKKSIKKSAVRWCTFWHSILKPFFCCFRTIFFCF